MKELIETIEEFIRVNGDKDMWMPEVHTARHLLAILTFKRR